MDLEADTVSTVIDTEPGPSASGGGQVPITPPADTDDRRGDLEAVFKAEAKKAEAKEAAKEPVKEPVEDKAPAPDAAREPEKAPESEDKPAEGPDQGEAEKQAEAQPEAKEQAKDDKPSRYPEPPAKFLPDAKEHWRNVPRAVQRDIATLTADHEREVSQYRESHERYESVRQFDELARSNGRELKDSLARVVEIENALQANPIAGLNRILMEIGPRKADGQPVSLYEVAEHIVRQGPEGYQQMVAQQPQQRQAPPEDPRISQLQQQLAAMQQQQLETTIIQPFAAAHPRYAELEADIAFFLQSGKIPDSLSAPERLEAAYDMAARINPASHASAQDQEAPDSDRRAEPSFSGSKSIKSAPGSVTEEVENEAPGGESIRETLRKEMRRLNR